VGLHRTASTMFHRLLAADPAVRAPHMWELLSPCPPPEKETFLTDPRHKLASDLWAAASLCQPDVAAEHECDFNGPEECMLGFNCSPFFINSLMGRILPNVREKYLKESCQAVYDDYRTTLQILSARYPPDRRWVLKCPLHLLHLDDLLETFPDADFIWIHRPVRDALPSVCRIINTVAASFHTRITGAEVGQWALKLYQAMITRGVAVREARPDVNFIDVSFDDLVHDPLSVVRTIYDKVGDELTDEAVAAMKRALAEHEETRRLKAKLYPGYKAGLREFGVSDEDLRVFAAYESTYLHKQK